MDIQVCSNEDLDLLAALNEQLIEDEQHDNTMNDFKAYLFKENGQVKGYAMLCNSQSSKRAAVPMAVLHLQKQQKARIREKSFSQVNRNTRNTSVGCVR